MSSVDKLGPYIQKLMTTVIDNKEDDFVKDLALTELNRLKVFFLGKSFEILNVGLIMCKYDIHFH